VEVLITIIIVFLFVGFIFRHLGKFLLPFIMRRMAKKFGMSYDAFRQNAQPAQNANTQPEPEQVIPDNVGEYVDFEEIK
jgi:hypothetical protein